MGSPSLFGRGLTGEIQQPSRGPLAQRFLLPPFSVLDTKTGHWQDRKRAWLSLGIQSEIGRNARAYNMGLQAKPDNQWSVEDTKGSGTSVFDPVVCELMYSWFCPPGGIILDPFAGGSVRGIVAGVLGYRYWGCDLRAEQINANCEQLSGIDCGNRVRWVCGDSAEKVQTAPLADFVFSCPPYGDLERYSDDPHDLSTMAWGEFMEAYATIINRSVSRLKDNAFACFVVGDFRDKNGLYRNFPARTSQCFLKAGCGLYNEIVLATSVGTAPMRAKQFEISRKCVKTHQNILVFIKGDPKAATEKVTKEAE